jgi:hypothetical protein
MPVSNDQGQVALFYLQPIQKLITLGNGHQYVFTVKRNVSLAFVAPEDVPACFEIRTGCCGHQLNPAFRYASESDVRIWSGTAER